MSIAELSTAYSSTRAATPAISVRPQLDRAARGALAGSVAAVPPITMLHLSATGPVEPSGWTISDYVVSLPHGTVLFALTAGALAIGAAALAHGLTTTGGTRPVRALLGLWAVGLVTAAVFPTNVRGTPRTLSADIHLYAGAIVFAAMPIAAWLLARWLRKDAAGRGSAAVLGVVALVAGLLSTALIANRLPGVFGLDNLMLPPGILQRVAGAAQIVLLALAGIAVLRSGRRLTGAVESR